MTIFDEIYEVAADNHGLITSAQAAELGAKTKDIARYVNDKRLYRVSRGVYRVRYYVPTPYDSYADAVAAVGLDAYIYGESVIAMYDLAPTNDSRIFVATPRRVRKSLPRNIRLVHAPRIEIDECDGIPVQPVIDAIASCRKTLMPERIEEAVKNGVHKGLLSESDAAYLLGKGKGKR